MSALKLLERPTCATCGAWYQREGDDGECRRHAPVQNSIDVGAGSWPATRARDWCAEHVEDEGC